MSEREVLKFISDRLRANFNVQRIVLFGSRARGDAEPESDYDVLVVAESDVPFYDRQALAVLALGTRDFAVDLLVYTPAELESGSAILGSAVYWALREGREFVA